MKNKLVFRILGALSSALIVVSVFVPYVVVNNYSQSIWGANSVLDTLYLPIMIIVFGVLGIIFFSINIKTELAYTSSGALIFYSITETIRIINQGAFKTLSIGYYFLVIGAILTGVMAFLCSLKSKKKEEVVSQEVPQEVSMIDQIDKLYNNQTVSSNMPENDMLINVIQPLPAQGSIIEENNVQSELTVQSSITGVVEENLQSIPQSNVAEKSIAKESSLQPIIQPVVSESVSQPNPVVSEFSNQAPVSQPNPVVSEFGNQAPVSQPNPVVLELGVTSDVPKANNPVVSEFASNIPATSQFGLLNTGEVQDSKQAESSSAAQNVESIQPLSATPQVDIMAQPDNSNGSNLDIFG